MSQILNESGVIQNVFFQSSIQLTHQSDPSKIMRSYFSDVSSWPVKPDIKNKAKIINPLFISQVMDLNGFHIKPQTEQI